MVAGDPLPGVGARNRPADRAGCPVGVLEVTDVRAPRPADADPRHMLDPGGEYASLAECRSTHEGFRHGPRMREAAGDPHSAAGGGQDTAAAAARPAARPEKMQPPRKVPSRAR